MLVIDAIAKILTALAPFAWPVVALIIAVLFRKELTGILARLRNAKLPGGSEVSFDRLLDEAEAESPTARPPALPPAAEARPEELSPEGQGEFSPEPQTFDRQYLSQIGKASPAAAIVIAFRYVENELLKALGSTRFVPHAQATKTLVERGRLSQPDAMLVRDLTALRNAAVHGGVQGLTYGDVVRYLRLIEDFLPRLVPREVTIKNNAVIAGAFPPNGPWMRSGTPPLADGCYKIVRHADGTWRLENDPDIVVFQPAFSRNPNTARTSIT